MSTLTGPTYKLAEFLNEMWEKRVSSTNQELATEWGYRAPGIISMWRTGKSRVPPERLPDIARLINVDLAVLLPLWLEQYTGDHGKVSAEIARVFDRLATQNEFSILRSMRNGAKTRGQKDPVFTARQIQAFEQIAASDEFANLVLDEANKAGLIAEIEAEEDSDS